MQHAYSPPRLGEGEFLVGGAAFAPVGLGEVAAGEDAALDQHRDPGEGAARPLRYGGKAGDVARGERLADQLGAALVDVLDAPVEQEVGGLGVAAGRGQLVGPGEQGAGDGLVGPPVLVALDPALLALPRPFRAAQSKHDEPDDPGDGQSGDAPQQDSEDGMIGTEELRQPFEPGRRRLGRGRRRPHRQVELDRAVGEQGAVGLGEGIRVERGWGRRRADAVRDDGRRGDERRLVWRQGGNPPGAARSGHPTRRWGGRKAWQFLPGTGRGTAPRSGGVEGLPLSPAQPLHQPPPSATAGPPPRTGEELGLALGPAQPLHHRLRRRSPSPCRGGTRDCRAAPRRGEGSVGVFRRLWRVLGARRRRQLGVTLAVMLAGAGAEMVTIGAVLPFLALLADPGSPLVGARLVGVLERVGGSAAIGATLLLVAAALIGAGLRLLLAWRSQQLVNAVGHDLAAALFARELGLEYAEQVRRPSGRTVTAVHQVDRVIAHVLVPAMLAVTAAVLASFIVAVLLTINALAAAAGAVAVAAIYLGLGRLVRRRLARNSATLSATARERTRTVEEALGGIRDILLDRSQPQLEARFGAVDRAHRRAHAANLFISTAPRFVIEAAGIVALAAAALALSLRPGGLVAALPVLGALALGAQRLLPLLQQAYHGWTQAAGNLQSLRDLLDIVELPASARAPAAAPAGPAFERSLELRGVGYGHPGGRFALRDVDLTIAAGEHVAIAGATGSGKSTLIDLVLGLLDPQSGEILIDGRPLGDEKVRAAWQAKLAHVPQAVYLADDTIAANIAFPRRAAELDPMRLEAALQGAQLEALVASLPDGLDTIVGERGVRLSGGQRQRIGLARALVRAPAVLILDEATSALDEATEAAVMRALAANPGLTLLTVAHRASTLGAAGRVVWLEAGSLRGDSAALAMTA